MVIPVSDKDAKRISKSATNLNIGRWLGGFDEAGVDPDFDEMDPGYGTLQGLTLKQIRAALPMAVMVGYAENVTKPWSVQGRRAGRAYEKSRPLRQLKRRLKSAIRWDLQGKRQRLEATSIRLENALHGNVQWGRRRLERKVDRLTYLWSWYEKEWVPWAKRQMAVEAAAVVRQKAMTEAMEATVAVIAKQDAEAAAYTTSVNIRNRQRAEAKHWHPMQPDARCAKCIPYNGSHTPDYWGRFGQVDPW